MADVQLRDLSTFGTKGRGKSEPIVPPPGSPPRPVAIDPAPAPALVTPPPPRPKPLFGGRTQHALAEDALGIDPVLADLAELALHQRTATPLAFGFLGAAGSGRSFALARAAGRIRDLAAAAAGTQGTPFVSRVHVQAVDAASFEGEPATALAGRLHAGLRKPYPDLARDLGLAARDPLVALREANDGLDDARRRLDNERRALDDAGSRRARLTETVLYEAAGSQVDAYARANRGAIESRLLGFGVSGDPLRSYKDLVQFVAGSGGRLGLGLRSLWAYKGQTKLLVAAVVLAAAGVGLGIAIDDQATWLAALRSEPKAGAGLAGWMEAHIDLLGTARSGAFGLAVLALLANLWRAAAFLRPILKGARLLESDLDARRRDLDGLYAHQTKRVDLLDGDVERLTRVVGEAERRAGGAGALGEPSPFAAGSAAPAFFAALADAMTGTTAPGAPQRVVVALDHLDTLAPERARAILDALHRVAAPGLVLLAAVDPSRLDPPGAHGDDLVRWIDVPVRLDAVPRDLAPLVRAALGKAPSVPVAKPDARRSALDEAVGDDEAATLAALADLAGATPRAVRRFVDLYALARLGTASRGLAAFMLAVVQGGTAEERRAVADGAAGDPASAFDPGRSPRLHAALAALGPQGRANNAAAAAALRRAEIFSFG